MKGKFLLALKSIMYLEKNANSSYEYLEALFKFIEYANNTNNSIPEDFLKLAKDHVNFEDGEKILEEIKIRILSNEKNPVRRALIKLQINKLNNKISNYDAIILELFQSSKLVLRGISQAVRDNFKK